MSARPQITITLGRSGQVVKKSGSIYDVGRTDYEPSSGNKRPIRERLGNNVEDLHSFGSRPYNDKRQRTEDHFMEETKQHTPGRQVGRDDLRFKLIQKSLSRRSNTDHDKRNNDLREKLSRNSQGPLRFGAPWSVPESRTSGLVSQIPSARSTEDLCHLGSLRKTYSFTSDRPRHISPGHVRASRVVSPPQFYDDMRHAPLPRSVGISRPTNLITNGVMDASRAEHSARKARVHVEATKPVLRAPSGTLQKTSYMSDEPVSVANLLHSLGLGKYAVLFQAEEVDMEALKQMGDNDLKEMGIPMGPRKKILLAVLPHSKQRRS